MDTEPQKTWTSDRTRAGLLCAVLAATLALYIRTAGFAFVYDDLAQIVDNPAIRSWANLPGFFTGSLFGSSYYRPLFLVWLAANHALFGGSPAGWHVTSVLVHVAVTRLVYVLARRLAGPRAGWIAAAVFGLHPVHIENVAWVSAVCDPLMAAFFVAGFLAYLRSQGDGGPSKLSSASWTMVACACQALALLSKEPAAVFPALVAAHSFVFGVGDFVGRATAALRRSAPFLLITAAYIAVRQSIIPSTAASGTHMTARTLLLTEPSVLWLYLQKLFWPVGLSAFYDTPYVSAVSWAGFVLPLVGITAVCAVVWVWARRSEAGKLIAFGAAWFLLSLAPVLYLRFLPYEEIVHDRYLYLPSIGFCLVIGLALDRLPVRTAQGVGETTWANRVVMGTALLLCFALVGLNLAQQGYWSSDQALYSRGLAIAPDNKNVANDYARMLTDRNEYAQAVQKYEQLLSRDPNYEPARCNLGYTYFRMGQYAEARRHLERAVTLNPLDALAYVYLGLVELRQQDLGAAETSIRRGIQIAPEFPGFHASLSAVLEAKGDLPGALAEVRQEMRYSPNYPGLLVREQELAHRVTE